jgi:serine kinase of HPr protein (carbohydrate metabolism regulator)
MNLTELPQALDLEVIQGEFEDRPLTGAYTSDLLSDVMAHADDVDILVTIQSHKNTVAVATLVGVAVIVVCNDRPVPEEMIEAARAESVGIYRSSRSQFEISGELYHLTAQS